MDNSQKLFFDPIKRAQLQEREREKITETLSANLNENGVSETWKYTTYQYSIVLNNNRQIWLNIDFWNLQSESDVSSSSLRSSCVYFENNWISPKRSWLENKTFVTSSPRGGKSNAGVSMVLERNAWKDFPFLFWWRGSISPDYTGHTTSYSSTSDDPSSRFQVASSHPPVSSFPFFADSNIFMNTKY